MVKSSLVFPIGKVPTSELRRLSEWYAQNQRTMPWRGETDPYKIWVSEMMLQQTQVKTVIPYYNAWIKVFPTLSALAAASEQAVLKQWEGLGYYSRARHFHRAAKIVSELFGRRVPSAYDDFIALPGVGPYAAAAVLSIAFGAPHAVVDGNVKRVFSRYFGFPHPIEGTTASKWFSQTAAAVLQRQLARGRSAGDHNQALMELGATVCTPRRVDCESCPLRTHCVARLTDSVDTLPKRRPRKKLETKRYLSLVVTCGDRILLKRRSYGEMLAGLWDFPQLLIKDDGDADIGRVIRNSSALTGLDKAVSAIIWKHLRSEYLVSAHQISELLSGTPIKHSYTHFKIELWPALIRLPLETMTACVEDLGAGFRCQEADHYRWQKRSDRELPMPKSAIKVWQATL